MKKPILWILVVCLFQMAASGKGQEVFPQIFGSLDNPNLRKIPDGFNKNYSNLNHFYVLANGNHITKEGNFRYSTIQEMYFTNNHLRIDLRIPKEKKCETYIQTKEEAISFRINDDKKFAYSSKYTKPIINDNLIDPRKFGGLGWCNFDLLQTLALLKNIKATETSEPNGDQTFLITGTNLDKKLKFEFTFSTKNNFLCSRLLIDYGEYLVLQEMEYSDIPGLKIKFPKKLSERYYKSKKDFESSRDKWYILEEFTLVCFPNYPMNEDLFKKSLPEGYTYFDPTKNLPVPSLKK